MEICFINPPFKPEFGKFSRESRSPAIGHSGVLYYPLWLIYAAAVVEKEGFEVTFVDAPAKRMDVDRCLDVIEEKTCYLKLFVLDTSTPSINFAKLLKEKFNKSFIVLVGTHPTATVEETLNNSDAIDAIARKEYDYIIRD